MKEVIQEGQIWDVATANMVEVGPLQIEGLAARIRERRDALTRAEQTLAAYAAAHGEHIAFWSAERLGKEAGVSDSTVVRFARTLGFSSYSDLQAFVQREISRLLRAPAPFRLRRETATLDGRGPLWESLHQDMANLESTLLHLDEPSFDRAVTAILEARQRYVLGLRGSAPLAHFLAYNLRGLLPSVRALTFTSETVLDEVLDVGAGDVVVAFAMSRAALRTLQFVRLARARGARVVCVVNDHLSPFVEEADDVLWVASQSRSYTNSLAAGMSLCHALLTAVGQRALDQAEARLAEIDEILVKNQMFAPSLGDVEPADA